MKQLPKVLIVDDTAENLLFLEVAVSKLKIELIKALSGEEALEKTRNVDLALALIDVRMPRINGYELAMLINKERSAAKVPVIFLTANFFDEKEVFKGYISGAVDYIFKPIDRVVLLSKINVFLDLYNQRQVIAGNAALIKKYAEELAIANKALSASEEKYRSYIKSAPDGVFVTSETGKYLEVNAAASRITGFTEDELITMSMSDMLLDLQHNKLTQFFDTLSETGFLKTFAILRQKDGAVRDIEINAVKIDKSRFLGFVKDITDRKLAEEALKESEHRFRSFFELTADLMVIADIDGYFRDINSSWTKTLGYSREELLGRPYLEFIHPDDLAQTRQIIAEKLQQGDTVLSFENRYLTKDGSSVWFEWSSQPNVTKGITFAIARNITDRKRAETELKNSLQQLHQLTSYIEKVRENERIAISRELHDDLGQALTAVKIDLGLIKQKLNEPEMLSRLVKVSALVSDTIKTVQRLTSQLRPQILDDLGLEAAIEWHTREFAERSGIEVLLEMDTEINIPPEAALTVFRIMQESLTNVARHSQASQVQVSLKNQPANISMVISDNGRGINESELNSKKSFGLIGMKERANSLGGTFEIKNLPGSGTQTILTFPLKSTAL